jgi:hypothetical protein
MLIAWLADMPLDRHTQSRLSAAYKIPPFRTSGDDSHAGSRVIHRFQISFQLAAEVALTVWYTEESASQAQL